MAINSAWVTHSLGDVATLQRGFDLPYRNRVQGSIPIVTSSGIEDFHNVSKAQGPGVITGRYGTIGEVFYVSSNYWPHNTTLYVKDFHGNVPKYIYYLMKTVDFASHSGKSGVPGVNRNDLHQEFVKIPPTLTEQEAIAGALSDADAWIESLEQLIAKKRQIKQGAMQELLTGKRRLPGFEVKRGYTQTEIGLIPKDWKLKSLGSISDISAGGTPGRGIPEFWNGGIPWVTTTEVNFGSISKTSQHISELGLKNSAAKLLSPGTILLALYGQGKTRGKVAILDIEAACNQACAAIVLTDRVSRFFVFVYLTSRYDFIRSLSNTGNQENLNGVIVKSIPIPLPPTIAEQEAIAETLSDMDTEIESLESKLAKASEVKQGMMQELLTGRMRLV